MSSHYAVLFNRRKGKLLSEQKLFYEAKLKEIQEVFNLEMQIEANGQDSTGKGKKVEAVDSIGDIEIRKLCESSVTKAASMAAGLVISTLFPLHISANHLISFKLTCESLVFMQVHVRPRWACCKGNYSKNY